MANHIHPGWEALKDDQCFNPWPFKAKIQMGEKEWISR
jgi:hypothetical protein